MPGDVLAVLEVGFFVVVGLVTQNAELQVGDLVEDPVLGQLLELEQEPLEHGQDQGLLLNVQVEVFPHELEVLILDPGEAVDGEEVVGPELFEALVVVEIPDLVVEEPHEAFAPEGASQSRCASPQKGLFLGFDGRVQQVLRGQGIFVVAAVLDVFHQGRHFSLEL